MTKSGSQKAKSPSQLIDGRIKELGDWRGEMLSRLRTLVKEADPEVVEEWKWRGVPVWEHDGIICTGETYKSVVKMTFAKGASLKDPSGLFNSSLEGNTRRAIDFHEGEKINERALKALVRAAVTLNDIQSKTLIRTGRLLAERFTPDERRTVEDDGAVLIGDRRAEACDRLVRAGLEHLDLGGDLIAGVHWRREVPLDVEKDAARSGEILRDDRVEEPGRHTALNDDAAEARARRRYLVVVQRVPVARDLGEAARCRAP